MTQWESWANPFARSNSCVHVESKGEDATCWLIFVGSRITDTAAVTAAHLFFFSWRDGLANRAHHMGKSQMPFRSICIRTQAKFSSRRSIRYHQSQNFLGTPAHSGSLDTSLLASRYIPTGPVSRCPARPCSGTSESSQDGHCLNIKRGVPHGAGPLPARHFSVFLTRLPYCPSPPQCIDAQRIRPTVQGARLKSVRLGQ